MPFNLKRPDCFEVVKIVDWLDQMQGACFYPLKTTNNNINQNKTDFKSIYLNSNFGLIKGIVNIDEFL